MCQIFTATLTNSPQTDRLKTIRGFISRFLFPRSPSSAWHGSVLFQSHKVKVEGWAGPGISPEALGKIPLQPHPGCWKTPVSSSRKAGFLISLLAGSQGSLSSPRGLLHYQANPPPSNQLRRAQSISHCKFIFHSSTIFSFCHLPHLSSDSR